MRKLDKLQLLRDMSLNANDLSSAISECDWKYAAECHHKLLDHIKSLESLLSLEPLPAGYAAKCTCLNCIPPEVL